MDFAEYTDEQLIDIQADACYSEDYDLAQAIETELDKRAGY